MYRLCPEEPGIRAALRDGETERRRTEDEDEDEGIERISTEEFLKICAERKKKDRRSPVKKF